MLLEEAEELALLYMEEHGVLEYFGFGFQNKKRSLGTCNYYRRKIFLSKWYVEQNNEEEIEDTILHEIAHALAWMHDRCRGHGRAWKKWCLKVGADPSRVHNGEINHPNGHFKYEETCCGVTYQRHRLRKNTSYYCPKCKDPLFEKYKS